MTPFDHARAVYDREPCARSFAEDLDAHLRNGYVFASPRFFVMGRAVIIERPGHEIVNPWITFNEGECNGWLVYLAAGDLRLALECLPYDLPVIGWERNNVLRWYDTAWIKRKLAKRRCA